MTTPSPWRARLTATVAAAALALVVVPSAADAASPAPETSRYVSVTPKRILDTREGLGAAKKKPAAGAKVSLKVLGVGGVPASGVTAVTLNVTVTDARQAGYVQALPAGDTGFGQSSNVNVYKAGQTVANLVTVPVGTGGKVTLYDVAGGHLVADVQGYFVSAATSTQGRYQPVTPTRLLDSRDRTGMSSLAPKNPGDVKDCGDFTTWKAANAWFWTYRDLYGDVAGLDGNDDRIPCESLPGNPGKVVKIAQPDLYPMPAAKTSITLKVAGRGGVPTKGAAAVALTVTATNSAAPGYVQVVPTGGATKLGTTSNVNLTGSGQTVANLVIVPVGSGGTVQLYNSSGTDVIADVVGYFTDTTAAASSAGLFVPVTPDRLADTRETKIAQAKSQNTFLPAGKAGLPTSGIGAVFFNVTATDTKGPGYLQVFPTGKGTPGASSSVNYTGKKQTVATAVIGSLGTGGKVTVYTPTKTHEILDVSGYFTLG